MKLFALFLCALPCVVLFSCHKNNAKPVTPPADTTGTSGGPGTTGTMKISLTLPNALDNCELIISETGGKVLLDTVAPNGTTINATLHTNASLVDVSTIAQYQPPAISMVTYKGVNPTGWKTAVAGTLPIVVVKPTTKVAAEILYKHVPTTDRLQFYDFVPGSLGFSYSLTYDSVDINYGQVAGNTSFLLFPSKGLYIAYIPKGLHDTVDCSKVTYDTASTASFPSSPTYTLTSLDLIGISDTTNTSAVIWLYSNWDFRDLPQIMFPTRTKMEKYVVSANFSSPATKESYALYNYGPAVNTTADYPASGAYSIHSAQKDNFSVTFNGIKPSYYNLTLTSGNLHWQLYASPDSVIVNPLALITAQNSKLLQGQSFGTLSLSAFGYLNVPGLGFSDYFNLASDPVLIQNKRVMHWDAYGKTF